MKTLTLMSLLLLAQFAQGEYVVDVFFSGNPTNVISLSIEPGQPASKDFDEYVDLGGKNEPEDKIGLGIQITVNDFSVSNETAHIAIRAETKSQKPPTSTEIDSGDFEFSGDSFDLNMNLPLNQWYLMGPAGETGSVSIVTKDKSALRNSTGFRIRSK